MDQEATHNSWELQRKELYKNIEASRPVEINQIKEALVQGQNVLITGDFVVGKTSLAQYIADENGYSYYNHFERLSAEDKKEMEKAKLVILDEIGNIAFDKKKKDRFEKLIKRLNSKGISVLATGNLGASNVDDIKPLFGCVIKLGLPSTASQKMREDHDSANKE